MSNTKRNVPRVAVPGHPGLYIKGERVQVRWLDHGKERTRSFRTLTEAVRFRRKTSGGETHASTREPFARYALRWVEEYQGRTARGLEEGTRASYRDALERFAIPYFRTTSMEKIDPPKVRMFIKHLVDGGSAPATVRRYFAPVRALFATAYEDGLIRPNPAAGVRVVAKDRRKRVPKWLTTDQTKALLAAMPASDADLAYFLAATGCRISEALRALWSDIGPTEEGVIALSVRAAKTAAGVREIPLSPETVRMLTKRRADARFDRAGHPIFPSSVGTERDSRNYRRRVFRPAAERAGVPWATPHKLRHGLASLMAKHGLGPEQIAAHLGHADGGVLALRTYIHPEGLSDTSFIDEALR